MDGSDKPGSRLAAISALGTSVWLDFVSRPLLAEGHLAQMIDTDDVRGVTSNPAIFEKSIAHGHDYDAEIARFQADGDHGPAEIFEHLAIIDIRQAADILAPVYQRTRRLDGYISLEVSPYLALRTEHTITEARHLWREVDRPNLMVKVPGTKEGVPAIRTLIGEGININVTLLFSIESYRAVAEAYMDGLEHLVAAGGDVSRVASVASFFVSRIDSAVDKAAQARKDDAALAGLRGKVAIANAKLAYQLYKELVASPRWQALAARGAMPQRLLWASTGTKLSGLPDTLYVDTLIGPDTVNTMPPATMDATRDHGTARVTIEDDLQDARTTLATLAKCGISLDDITTELVSDGVQQFADAADKLYGAVAASRQAGGQPGQTMALGTALQQQVDAAIEQWRAQGGIRRLWAGDAALWTGGDEAKWTGWLQLVEQAMQALPLLEQFQQEVKSRNLSDVVLLGMGGSSLGPEVLAQTFGSQPGFPTLHIVDSTDPAQLRAVAQVIDLKRCLFIVSSKSGSTLEPNIFKAYFFDLVKRAGIAPGPCFVAVTDPGSATEKTAREDGFAHVFHGLPSVGGRFSVLSMFGLVPAAAIGLDLRAFLTTARWMVRSCGPDVPPAANPGVQLGLAMGCAARAGRDKLTIFASPGIADIGAWLEQLVAESTGKRGHGIVPIDLEPVASPAAYGEDRLFVYLELQGQADQAQRAAIQSLQDAGQPVIRIDVPDTMHLGQEFFRFEIATAVAGAVIGIDPFDQPDVEASKVETRKLMDAVKRDGALPPETALFSLGGISLYADDANAQALGRHDTLAGWLRALFARIRPGDYVALLAYVQRGAASIAALQQARTAIRDATRAATAVGFGPRFLHSTGQAYKGGPDSGVFLQITCDDAQDLDVPGYGYGFGMVKAAQARGDLAVLNARGRRALRIHLPADVAAGLATLNAAIIQALA